jgi:Zn-finger nucleic acid-binding protein
MSEVEHTPVDCPACSRELTLLNVNDTIVDVCHHGCGGIWFDHFELQKFDGKADDPGEMLNVVKDADVHREPGQRLRCPRCRDVVLRQHFFSIKQKVEVDSCPGCGGYWLDHGELQLIGSEFDTDESREQATRKFMDDLDDQHVDEACPVAMEKTKRVTTLSAMLRIVGSRYR